MKFYSKEDLAALAYKTLLETIIPTISLNYTDFLDFLENKTVAFYTVSEFCTLLSLNKQKCHQFLNNNDIPSMILDGKRYIPAGFLKKLIIRLLVMGKRSSAGHYEFNLSTQIYDKYFPEENNYDNFEAYAEYLRALRPACTDEPDEFKYKDIIKDLLEPPSQINY